MLIIVIVEGALSGLKYVRGILNEKVKNIRPV